MRATIFPLLGSLLAVPPVIAQTVLDGSSTPTVGQSYDYDIADTLDLPGIGAGQVWDASGALVVQTDNVSFDAVGNGVAGSTFPTADVVMFNGANEIYVDATADGLYVVGTYNGSLPITSVYTDPQRYLQLPCSLGTAWSDPYAGSYDYAGITYAQSGNATFLATGYGSLVLPWGTVDNVLRVDGSEDYVESGNGNTYAYTATFTNFYKPGLGYFVARQVNGTGVLNGATVAQVDQLIYMQASSIGLAENEAQAFGMEVHPNPVAGAGTLVYTAEGDLTLRLFDAAGRCVEQHALGQVMPGLHRMALSVDDLPAGLYTAVLEARDGGRGVVRFVVER